MNYETPLFFHVMEYADAADRDVIDMVSGNPDWQPPDALREGLREYADLEPDRFQYPPSEGLLELREEIATRRGVDADRIVVTNGAGEANYLAMARALERDSGDEILLTDPVYPYYPGKTTMLGGTQSYVATDEAGQLDPDDVRAAASAETAAIVVNTPNNPTGAVYPAETMRELVAIAEEVDAVLISDEVYDHYDLSGEFASALEIDSDHRVVTNAVSKSMAVTGVRVGYAVFPPGLVANAKSRHMLVNVATTRPGQYAVLKALRETGPDYYERNRQRLRDRVETFTDALDAAGAEYTSPSGSFYVMARFDGYPGTLENVERLIDEAGVAGMPGEAFGDSRTEWLRFALVTPCVEEAAERLARYFD
ncbi:pyridoxal phosphate-dependent aminotransferase [Natrinema longum]|uniref:Pyridoxal phosphate-dependent aminotransferase n=1 Tax=Natrinema longum TaxID=370324 RepID=A0A8A2UAM0_9EURY|nr:pyridoxal phosphate-dependent aminotransferase [Natrinema longum]MBZ6493418.1 pyridoxal phosphate-dependent aminotransferase [Natrinema longum]QSW85235.1 pyridoxal phosphate-dependent aminotransferase [Natrinema longum]